ncbi:PIR Superfamily Protein [Plasmodium ovale curtisi]|uniref:PIR Superfamily Protein n=1 Tax=Plasmodium ovale curtisi TaxID=864141 RepID=A0A1A8VNG9_PLAOA|nr:PIR Superfamily Protein [Plasmodium ovale curtisi]SBS99052.1 PIR Superfamily Protein [Plasmodium ovale curtisi]
MDTNALNEKYPFFKNIWGLYDIFNSSLNSNDSSRYNAICKGIITEDNLEKPLKTELCMKLLRNLVTLSYMTIPEMNFNDRCRNLNDWLFYQTKQIIIDDNVISKIFGELEEKASEFNYNKKCYYSAYNTNFNEPENIIKIKYFVDNITTIKSTLEENNSSSYCLCRNYIYECIDIYRKMIKQYCDTEGKKNTQTCEQVKTFLTTYSFYLSDWIQIKDKIISSTFTQKEYLGECAPKDEAKVLISGKDDNRVVGGVTGTLAGACLSLLTLYKYSPVGSMLRSRLQSWNQKDNNLDEEQELLFDGTGNNNIYSDDMTYHIQYHSL